MGCNLWMIGYLDSLLGLALPMHEALLDLASGVRLFSSFLPSLADVERVRSVGELGGRRKGIGQVYYIFKPNNISCNQAGDSQTSKYTPFTCTKHGLLGPGF
jgi:hypothetical protein